MTPRCFQSGCKIVLESFPKLINPDVIVCSVLRNIHARPEKTIVETMRKVFVHRQILLDDKKNLILRNKAAVRYCFRENKRGENWSAHCSGSMHSNNKNGNIVCLLHQTLKRRKINAFNSSAVLQSWVKNQFIHLIRDYSIFQCSH